MNRQFWLNCGLLRLFDELDASPDESAPCFQYDLSHPEFKRLREDYHLDRIAGSGDEWSKIRKLMRWMTEGIWHRGNISKALAEAGESLPMDALGLLEYSFGKEQGRGINCYMLSIVLTELCLSLGVKCRLVSLNPLNPYDYDNHVVVVAWCTSISKWVMADPSYNAYLCDSDGQILSPWETRDRFCQHETVLCNDELSYNRGKHSSEEYLTYMAKNLIYLHSPTYTGYGSTTTSKEPWLTLAPRNLDVCKRETYNLKWHKDGESGKWQNDELLSAVEKRRLEGKRIYTSSIASFAQVPN